VLRARPVAKPGDEHAFNLLGQGIRVPAPEALALDRLAEIAQRERVAKARGGALGRRVRRRRLRLRRDEAGFWT